MRIAASSGSEAFDRFYDLLHTYVDEHLSCELFQPTDRVEVSMDDGLTHPLLKRLELCYARPPLYLGVTELSTLKAFISGYMVCLKTYSLPFELDFSGFTDYVAEQCAKTQSKDLYTMIMKRTQNEKLAFEEFFRLFFSFLELKGIKRQT